MSAFVKRLRILLHRLREFLWWLSVAIVSEIIRALQFS
jgi:hypothetical protein